MTERLESDTACLLEEDPERLGAAAADAIQGRAEAGWRQTLTAWGRSEPLLLWTLVGVVGGVLLGGILHAAHGGPLEPSAVELLGLPVNPPSPNTPRFYSLGDAKSSLCDAKSSLRDA
jgi:hypothetical protein